jgi:hypothetical protein
MQAAPKKPNAKTPETPETGAEPSSLRRQEDEATRTASRPAAAQHLSTGRYDPKDLGELMRYCNIVVKSQLCPRHIKSPADAMLIIQRGAELGLSAVNALQNLNVISGNVTMPAALAVGVVKASDACEYFTCIKSTEEYSTWETKRRGNPEPTRYTFSKHDAQVAGLWGSGTWRKYPRNLLAARASMNLARMEYQDVLVGVYTPEELEVTSAQPHPVVENAAPPVVEGAAPETEAEPEADASAESEEKNGEKKRPRHWSEEPVEKARDRSRSKKWKAQNERFHALMRAGDVEAHCEAFREFIKERHAVDSWTHLPAELIEKWCDLIAKKRDEVDEDGDARSERAEWVRQKLARHAEASKAA